MKNFRLVYSNIDIKETAECGYCETLELACVAAGMHIRERVGVYRPKNKHMVRFLRVDENVLEDGSIQIISEYEEGYKEYYTITKR